MNTIKGKRLFQTYPSSSTTTTPYPTIYTSVIADTTFTVPAGYMLEYMTFLNATANDAVLNLGTTAGGAEVFALQTVNGTGLNGGLTTFTTFIDAALNGSLTLYLNDSGGGSWNAASFTVYLALRKII